MGFDLGGILKGIGNAIAPGITTALTRPGDLLKKPGNMLNLGLDLAGGGFLGGGAKKLLGTGVGKGLQYLTGAGGGIPNNLEDLLPAVLGMGAGGGLNALTDPFGFKLGPGGPYADRGIGDRQLGIGDQMAGFGKDLLGGFGGNMKLLMDLQSQLAGLPGFGGGSNLGGMTNQAGQVGGQGPGFDPFKLAPHQEQAQNLFADQINQGRQSALSQTQHSFNQRGITDPRASAALMARTNMGANTAIAGNRSNLMNNAFDTRMGTLESLQRTLFGLGGMGQNLLSGASNIFGQGANRALDTTGQKEDTLGSLLGFAGSNPQIQAWLKGVLKKPGKKPVKMKSDFGPKLQPGQVMA